MNVFLKRGGCTRRCFSNNVVMESKFVLFYDYVADVLEKRGTFYIRAQSERISSLGLYCRS